MKRMICTVLAVAMLICFAVVAEAVDVGSTNSDDTSSESEALVSESGAEENSSEEENTDPRAVILNSAELIPLRTNYPLLDARVDEILAQITKAEMDTYEKVKACYTYCVEDSVYYQHKKWYDELYAIRDACGYENLNDVWMIYEASFFLEDKHGVCDDYSAAFTVLCRAIGLDAYYVWGQTNKASGGYTGHAWVNICVDGVYYHFDPQVEANITQRNDGVIGYHRFCVTDEEMEGRLIIEDRAECINAFGGFACKLKATLSVEPLYAKGMTLPRDIILGFDVDVQGFPLDSTLSLYYMAGDSAFDPVQSVECEGVTVEGGTLSWKPNMVGEYTVFVVVTAPNGMMSYAGFKYKFYRFDDPTEILGDVNGDGRISPLDASLVLQYDAKLLVIDIAYIKSGDFNGDGKISPLDASLILQYDANLFDVSLAEAF